MRCRHVLRRFDSAIVFAPHETTESIGAFGPGWVNVPGQHRCERCWDLVPLGASNDEPEAVKVEMRAARIGSEPPWGAVPDATRDEIDGWRSFDPCLSG